MQACRCDFAAGVKIFNACFGGQISFNAAYHIMSARADRNKFTADIYAEIIAKLENLGEPF